MFYGKKVKFSELKRILIDVLSDSEKDLRRIPATFIWGAPGIGKSALVREVASELGFEVEDVRLIQLESVDIRGIPTIAGEIVRWTKPYFLPDPETKTKGILFLDEINLADPSVQAASYQLILDRRIGEYILPRTWYVICAGNRYEDNPYIFRIPAPLANRFIHFELIPDVDEWIVWATKKGIDQRIISYIKFRPEHLYTPASDEFVPYATPRSWEFASTILAERAKRGEFSTDISYAVGLKISVEFESFIKVYERLPKVEDVLEQGLFVDLSKEKDVSVVIAYMVGLASRLDPKNESHVRNVVEYLIRLLNLATEENRLKEYCLFLLKLIIKKGVSVDEISKMEVKKIERTTVGKKVVEREVLVNAWDEITRQVGDFISVL